MSKIDGENINVCEAFVLREEDIGKTKEILNAKQLAAEILNKANAKAQQIEEQANAQAKALIDEAIADANAKKDEIEEEARQAGHQLGYQAGLEKIQSDLTAKIENVDRFAHAQFQIKERIIKSAHNDIVNLVISICDKICHKKLNTDNEILYNIVKASINLLKDKESVNIIVNPEMAHKIYDISENLKDEILSLQNIKIMEDVSVSTDGAIVEGLSSRVDGRISSQIDEITQKLLIELQTAKESELSEEAEKNVDN